MNAMKKIILPSVATIVVAIAFGSGAIAFAQAAGDASNAAGAAADQSGQSDFQADDQQIDAVVQQIAQDPKTAEDKMFLLTTVLNNRAEIDLAQKVMQKTQNPQIKQAAQKLIDQLQRENQELTQTAKAVGLQIPPGLHQAQVAEVNIVAQLPADQLDKAYTADQQAQNASDQSSYQSEASIGQDPQVKQLAERQLQAQQQRSQDWNQSATSMGMPSTGGGGASASSGSSSGGQAQPAGASIPAQSDRNSGNNSR